MKESPILPCSPKRTRTPFSGWIGICPSSIEEQERFRLAMRSVNEGLFDWNLKTNEIYFSPVWKKLLGYEDHEIKNEFSEWKRLTDPEVVKEAFIQQQLPEVFKAMRTLQITPEEILSLYKKSDKELNDENQ